MVSVIIVNYNGLQFTKQCLDSLANHHQLNSLEVIVVDNNSTDGSQSVLPSMFPFIQFLSLSQNYGFGAANNAGARLAKGDILFFVNNDIIFTQPIAESLAQFLTENSSVGIVSPKLLNEDGSFQLSFGNFPTIRNERQTKLLKKATSLNSFSERSNSPIKKDWLTGAALMIKREIFEEIKGFDEKYFMYFEDIDLCKSVQKKGYQCIYVPTLDMIHLGGKSYQRNDSRITIEYRRSQLRYYDKHNSFIQRVFLRIYLFVRYVLPYYSRSEKANSIALFKLLLNRN